MRVFRISIAVAAAMGAILLAGCASAPAVSAGSTSDPTMTVATTSSVSAPPSVLSPTSQITPSIVAPSPRPTEAPAPQIGGRAAAGFQPTNSYSLDLRTDGDTTHERVVFYLGKPGDLGTFGAQLASGCGVTFI
jgi:hypothetical protein